MATQYANMSYALPVKFYPVDGTNNNLLDYNFAKNRLLPIQRQVTYNQRWQVSDATPLQIETTIAPSPLVIWDCNKTQLGTIAWTEKLTSGISKVYELILNLDDYNNKTVHLYQKCELLETKFEFISEAISIRTTWPLTNILRYKDSKNIHGLWFITGVEFKYRVECAILDYEPQNESTDFVDELHDTKLLSATCYDKYTFYIGNAAGVADWSSKLLNYIIHCDNWKYQDLQFAKISGEKWDINREKNYPLMGKSIGVTPAINLNSSQLNALSVEPGIVTGIMLDTNFFGTSTNEIELEEITTTD